MVIMQQFDKNQSVIVFHFGSPCPFCYLLTSQVITNNFFLNIILKYNHYLIT